MKDEKNCGKHIEGWTDLEKGFFLEEERCHMRSIRCEDRVSERRQCGECWIAGERMKLE